MWRHRFAADVGTGSCPAACSSPGEDPAVTAARELEEETGYRARELEHVVDFEPAIGMVRNRHHVFVGRGAEQVASRPSRPRCSGWSGCRWTMSSD